MTAWFWTFVLTVLVELAVALPILGLEERRLRRRVRLIVVANALTHPLVYALVASARSPAGFMIAVVLLEALAAIVEAFIYAKSLDRRALPLAIAASCLANAASFGASIYWG